MLHSLRQRWLNLLYTLWFVPGAIVLAYCGLAIGVVHVDATFHPSGALVFGGSGTAARTVLSTIAGSLITVAGVTFSITIVAIQLASSQFTPRVLRAFLGDRVTQVTIGSFVGVFAYCLLSLRAVTGPSSSTTFVPRLAVTLASALALVTLGLLIAFIHRITKLVQVSELTARIAQATLESIDRLYPEPFGEGVEEDAAVLLDSWHAEAEPAHVWSPRPGFVQHLDLAALAAALPGGSRVHMRVAPGDFAGLDEPVADVWAPDGEKILATVPRSVTIAGERDLGQDTHFGVRQLADIALRAISPGINDLTTAATAIAYLRSILVVLAAREFPPTVRRDRDVTIVARRREFPEHLDALAEIGRYANGDARIAGDLLRTLCAIAVTAAAAGVPDRAADARTLAEALAEQAIGEARTTPARELLVRLTAAVGEAASGAPPPAPRR